MIDVHFNYQNVETVIQCFLNDKIKEIINQFLIKTGEKEKEEDLNFSYNEIEINKELTFNELIYDIDKKEKKVNIIVSKNKEDKNKTKEKISKEVIPKEIMSKEIICPEPDCKEPALIDINSFRINFKECKNKHQINNIPLKDYEKSQTINQEDIKCDLCYIKNYVNQLMMKII